MYRLTLIILIGLTGCAKQQIEPASLSKKPAPVPPQPPTVTETLHRLMETSPSQAGRIPSPLETSVDTFSIDSLEELAADGRRFSLSVDASSEQA